MYDTDRSWLLHTNPLQSMFPLLFKSSCYRFFSINPGVVDIYIYPVIVKSDPQGEPNHRIWMCHVPTPFLQGLHWKATVPYTAHSPIPCRDPEATTSHSKLPAGFLQILPSPPYFLSPTLLARDIFRGFHFNPWRSLWRISTASSPLSPSWRWTQASS